MIKLKASPISSYRITSPYGMRKGSMHNGIDLAEMNRKPTDAFLMDKGRIIRVDHEVSGYGRYVIIEHAGYCTLYAHLGKVYTYIIEGSVFEKGTPIGLVGNTGASRGTHLHLEISLGAYKKADFFDKLEHNYNPLRINPAPILYDLQELEAITHPGLKRIAPDLSNPGFWQRLIDRNTMASVLTVENIVDLVAKG